MAKFDIIAATGCPTGIAHTFMAKEALEKAAAELCAYTCSALPRPNGSL